MEADSKTADGNGGSGVKNHLTGSESPRRREANDFVRISNVSGQCFEGGRVKLVSWASQEIVDDIYAHSIQDRGILKLTFSWTTCSELDDYRDRILKVGSSLILTAAPKDFVEKIEELDAEWHRGQSWARENVHIGNPVRVLVGGEHINGSVWGWIPRDDPCNFGNHSIWKVRLTESDHNARHRQILLDETELLEAMVHYAGWKASCSMFDNTMIEGLSGLDSGGSVDKSLVCDGPMNAACDAASKDDKGSMEGNVEKQSKLPKLESGEPADRGAFADHEAETEEKAMEFGEDTHARPRPEVPQSGREAHSEGTKKEVSSPVGRPGHRELNRLFEAGQAKRHQTLGVYKASRPLVTDDSVSRIPVRVLNSELCCPICLSICRSTYTIMECLHRFCQECIEKHIRLGQKECPKCRVKISSRRALRPDPYFDVLIHTFYPVIDYVEANEDKYNSLVMSDSAHLATVVNEGLVRQAATAKAGSPIQQRKVCMVATSSQDISVGVAAPTSGTVASYWNGDFLDHVDCAQNLSLELSSGASIHDSGDSFSGRIREEPAARRFVRQRLGQPRKPPNMTNAAPHCIASENTGAAVGPARLTSRQDKGDSEVVMKHPDDSDKSLAMALKSSGPIPRFESNPLVWDPITFTSVKVPATSGLPTTSLQTRVSQQAADTGSSPASSPKPARRKKRNDSAAQVPGAKPSRPCLSDDQIYASWTLEECQQMHTKMGLWKLLGGVDWETKYNRNQATRVKVLFAAVHAVLPKKKLQHFLEVWPAESRSHGKLIETFVTGALRTRQNRCVENLKKLFRNKIVGLKTVVDGKTTVEGPDPSLAVLLGLQVPKDQTLTEVAFPSAVHPENLVPLGKAEMGVWTKFALDGTCAPPEAPKYWLAWSRLRCADAPKVQALKITDPSSKAVVNFNNSTTSDKILNKTVVLYNELFPEIYDTVMSSWCQEGRSMLITSPDSLKNLLQREVEMNSDDVSKPGPTVQAINNDMLAYIDYLCLRTLFRNESEMSLLVSPELLGKMQLVWDKDHGGDEGRKQFTASWEAFLAKEKHGVQRKRSRARSGPVEVVDYDADELGLDD